MGGGASSAGRSAPAEQQLKPEVLERLLEEFRLSDEGELGYIDEHQFRNLLIRRVTRSKLRNMEALSTVGRLPSTDIMQGIKPTQTNAVSDISSCAFTGRSEKMTFDQFLQWQLNYENHSLGLNDGSVWNQAKSALRTCYRVATGHKPISGGEVASEPSERDRLALAVPEPVSAGSHGANVPGRVGRSTSVKSLNTSVNASKKSVQEGDENESEHNLTRLEKHTLSLKRLRALEGGGSFRSLEGGGSPARNNEGTPRRSSSGTLQRSTAAPAPKPPASSECF